MMRSTPSSLERSSTAPTGCTEESAGLGQLATHMHYVFGPVPSRRLGRSLGIDPVPLKTCNWNCVYCQLGRSVPMRHDRAEYVPREAILRQVEDALAAAPPGSIDWITFVGSGEPTLHSSLGWLMRRVRTLTNLPLAVITNGSLLSDPAVRDELSATDAVLPSIDAGTSATYRRIDRPWPSLTLDAHIAGLIEFRSLYTGTLWAEVMLIDGMNNTDSELLALRQALESIHPDRVSVLSPIRPQAEAWVRCASNESLARAQAFLGAVAPTPSAAPAAWGRLSDEGLRDEILSVVTRHPMSEDELLTIGASNGPERVHDALRWLESQALIRPIVRQGRTTWSNAEARYSQSAVPTSPADTAPSPAEPAPNDVY
jgi:wyosine [tRNA(Phe)-imidazoG37] synthetase (radical SAM superfamily)